MLHPSSFISKEAMRIFLVLLLLTAGCRADGKPKIDVGKLYQEASSDKEGNRTGIAIKKFEYLESRVKPENKPLIWFDLGICHMQVGFISMAEAYLTKVIDAKDDIINGKHPAYDSSIVGKSYFWLADIDYNKWVGRDRDQELKYREMAVANGFEYFKNTERMAELYKIKADSLYEVENPDKPAYLDMLRRAELCEELAPKQRKKAYDEIEKRDKK